MKFMDFLDASGSFEFFISCYLIIPGHTDEIGIGFVI